MVTESKSPFTPNLLRLHFFFQIMNESTDIPNHMHLSLMKIYLNDMFAVLVVKGTEGQDKDWTP